MEIIGKVILIMPTAQGEKNGKQWRRQECVVETLGEHPHRCVFSVFNDKIEKFNLTLQQCYKLSVDIDAREYKGNWYNSVTCFRAEQYMAENQSSAQNLPDTDVPY